jgi:tetratricopeptide (TPR) repeat protein
MGNVCLLFLFFFRLFPELTGCQHAVGWSGSGHNVSERKRSKEVVMFLTRYFIVVGVSMLLLAGAWAKGTDPPGFPGVGSRKAWEEACTINTRATQEMQDGKNKQAITLLKQAIAKYPQETGFYDNLGQCYLARGDTKLAESAFRQAVQLSDKYGVKYPDSYVSLARLCEKRGAVKEADGLYKKAIKLNDASLDAWQAYADFLDAQKRLPESAAAKKKVAELQQSHKQFLKRLAK